MVMTRYFRARHVAPMNGAPVIEDGCIAVEGERVVDVGTVRRIAPPRIDVDIDGLLSPGLVNLHAHLELTDVPRPAIPGTFQEWLTATMAAAYEPDADVRARRRQAAVRSGVEQCLRFGVTAVADITQSPDAVRPVLERSPLRIVSYGECLGLGGRRSRFEELLARAAADPRHVGRLKIGVSPHAPYTVDAAGYAESWSAVLSDLDIEWTTHLAETPDEMAFVRERSGPFRLLYERLGLDPGPPEATNAATPVAWLDAVLGDTPGATFAHVNYCTDADLDLMSRRRAVVVWCPRTHAYFGHPPHRWRDMQARGITVAVGTDSCASAADLNLMDDLRAVRRQWPEIPASAIWALATSNCGLPFLNAAGLFVGQIDHDAYADFTAWPTSTTLPLDEVLDTPGVRPTGVWIGGEAVEPPADRAG